MSISMAIRSSLEKRDVPLAPLDVSKVGATYALSHGRTPPGSNPFPAPRPKVAAGDLLRSLTMRGAGGNATLLVGVPRTSDI